MVSKMKFGTNQKWIIRPDTHPLVRRMLGEVFGGTPKSPRPGLEIFTFAGGEHVGLFIEADAPDAPTYAKTAWLEFSVDDIDKTAKLLESAGVSRVHYDADHEHLYFQAGASPVFRLAKK